MEIVTETETDYFMKSVNSRVVQEVEMERWWCQGEKDLSVTFVTSSDISNEIVYVATALTRTLDHIYQ